MQEITSINFRVNEKDYTVGNKDVPANITLNTYLRSHLHLTGTKRMCLEGGCGCCSVSVETTVDNKKRVFAINSCLVSLFSCHKWNITTIEGIGNPTAGYHTIQKLLADKNGTQCGFCSPAMVMSMYSLNKDGKKTMKEIENSFGGNICRCTGYRPILSAFKTLASDTPGIPCDVEDIQNQPCGRGGGCCKQRKTSDYDMDLEGFYVNTDEFKWVKCYKFSELLSTLETIGQSSYMLVAGNTARGVYKNVSRKNVYIDIMSIPELTSYKLDTKTLVLGGNVRMNTALEIFKKTSESYESFKYLECLANHFDLIAGFSVRNLGTIAGNLMIKHEHIEFPSDIFLVFETFKANLVLVDSAGKETTVSPSQFLLENMEKRVLKSIEFTALDNPDTYKYQSYKIMPRAQNAHAFINAAFFIKLNSENIVEQATVVYGGVNKNFIHAKKTEKVLIGKKLFDNVNLQTVLQVLDSETVPDYIPPDASAEFRKKLAISLFYKFVLNIAPKNVVSSKYLSGGTLIARPVSTATQEFGTNEEKFPLGQPVDKIEALAQTSGQAEFVDDIPDQPNQLFASFVLTKAKAFSKISSIDATEALKTKGVVAFYSAKDIPGLNTFTPVDVGLVIREKIFCEDTVEYYNQPIGIIVAEDMQTSIQAANLVTITYAASKIEPLLSIDAVLKSGATDRLSITDTITPTNKGTDVKKVIKGEFNMHEQYHFHMENQTCCVIPNEDGLDMYPSTQWMDLAQVAASTALNIHMNKINVRVRRCGGGFGGKIVRNAQVSTATALAAYKLNRPVRMWLPLETNMQVIGKRIPVKVQYETGVNDKGVIQYVDAKFYSDFGIAPGNEFINMFMIALIAHAYDKTRWGFTLYTVKTDKHANCYCRAPGSVEGMGATEAIMEHIAYSLNLDPWEVRMANYKAVSHPKIKTFLETMKNWGEIKKRQEEVNNFNKENRWKKKGFSLVPMAWQMDILGNYSVYISVFHKDGTVAVCHGGIEIGQGINTKVAQACAYKLGIDLNMVTVKPSFNIVSPNSFTTGGSWTSEAIVSGLLKACDSLLARMKPVKDQMSNPTWVELVNKCYALNIRLNETSMFAPSDVASYMIYGLVATDVEVDILTGQKQITRVDIIEDVGDSMSPLVDIGQVEGAFVMGIGYYTQEEIIFNDEGRLLTDRTWNYKPPGAKDIPLNFRVKFPENNPNPVGTLKSKAIGEPPLCLSVSVALAMRSALASARKEADPNADKWIPFDGPLTVEKTLLNALGTYKQYLLK